MSTNNRFNNVGSSTANLSNGTASLYINTLQVAGLNPREMLATDSMNNIISTTDVTAPTNININANNGAGVVNVVANDLQFNGTSIINSDPNQVTRTASVVFTNGTSSFASTLTVLKTGKLINLNWSQASGTIEGSGNWTMVIPWADCYPSVDPVNGSVIDLVGAAASFVVLSNNSPTLLFGIPSGPNFFVYGSNICYFTA